MILKKIEERKLKAKIVLVFSNHKDARALEIARKFHYATSGFSVNDFKSLALYEEELLRLLKSKKAEWIVCAGYKRLIREPILSAFKERIINIHPSLLPSFIGLKAPRQAIQYGVKYAGCTVHFVDDGMDTGHIIAQRVVPVLPEDDEESLSIRILKQEHYIYWRALSALFKGYKIKDRKVIFSNEPRSFRSLMNTK